MTHNMTSAQARNHFPDLVNQATYAKTRTVITKRGKQVAAIVPIEDLAYLESLEDARDIKKIEQSLQENKFEDWNSVKKRLLASHGLTEKDFKKMIAESEDVQAEDCQEG